MEITTEIIRKDKSGCSNIDIELTELFTLEWLKIREILQCGMNIYGTKSHVM